MIEPDIAKLLELLPLIEQLPIVVGRLDELEARDEEAEARLIYAAHRTCPYCYGQRVLSKPRPETLFPGSTGRIRVFRCLNCEREEEISIQPLDSRPFGVDF